MTGYVVRAPGGTVLHRGDDPQAAFAFRADWNLARWAYLPQGDVAQVFEVAGDGSERLVDRVQLLADALGVDRAELGG